MQRLTLFSEIEPYEHLMLAVDAAHVLYVEQCGNPKGLPVLFLHGGPGAGCETYHRRFFDPKRYRIVLFDQRGCGRSRPHAELGGNTTPNLVRDIERIRERLSIDKWVVFGGSWGSTLALAYTESHPQHVLGLILRGIFLCRKRDIEWFYQDGTSRLFPDFWQDYLTPIPVAERDDLVRAYYQRLTGDDEVTRMAAAKAWSMWEGRTLTLRVNPDVINHFADPHVALSMARIECHYFVNDSFLTDNQLLEHADRLHDIPGSIIHGRYDVICPPDQAFALHQAWPQADLQIIEDAGHAATEPGTVDALIRATQSMYERYR